MACFGLVAVAETSRQRIREGLWRWRCGEKKVLYLLLASGDLV